MKRFLSWVLMCVFAAACLGQVAVQAEASPRDSVIVVMGPTSEPEAGFDPAYGWGAGEHVHEPLIQSTLTVTNQDLTIGYDLATGMEVSEDGLLWRVRIREDVRFSDGVPLTAHDVAFTYNTVKEKSTVNDFTMLEGAVARDEFTVEFLMNRPYAVWPYTMSIVGIVPRHAYTEHYGQNPVGSGRYMLRQWDRGQQAIFEANPLYYGDAPRIKRVTVLFMSEDAAYVSAMSGQADIVYTAATYAEGQIPGYALLSFESVDNRGLNLPTLPRAGEMGNDVTYDLAIRRAMNIGIDRQALIDQVLGGHGKPAFSVCDNLPWFDESGIVEFNREEAIAILEEAGWEMGAGGVRVKNGVSARLPLLYPASDSVRQALASAVAEQLLELGIECSPEGVGWDVAYDRAQREVMTWGWGAHTPMELYNLHHTQEGTGLAAYTPYANKEVDAYMDQALSSQDLEASYQLWKKAQWDGEGGINADLPWVWLVNIDHLYWAREGLHVAEQKIHPHGHGWSLVNNVDRWFWSQP